MMNHLNYHQLFYFHRIAQEKSLSAASKSLLVSVPALSMQLKELEDQVGTSLFIRKGKGVVLTDMGALVYEYSKDIFSLGQELQDTINDKSIGRRLKRIEIGCENSIPKFILESLVSYFLTIGAKVVVRETSAHILKTMLENFELDMILLHSRPTNFYDDVHMKRIFKEKLVLASSPEIKKIIQSKKNQDVPLILNISRPMTPKLIDHYWTEVNKNPHVIAEIEDHQTEIDLAIKGHGAILTHKSSINRALKNKHLTIAYELPILDEVWMVLGERKKNNELAQIALRDFSLS